MTALEESSMTESLTSVKTHSRKRQKSSRSSPNPDSSTPVAESMDVNCLGASRVLLTKDLRHKRVFSPAVNSEFEEKYEEQSKLLEGFVPSAVPDFDVKMYKLGKSRFARSEVGDERMDGANDLKLKDQTIPGNGSLPKMKMAPNGCQRKKIFNTPNSFSYRRLLPHLMDIVNNTSSVSKFELVDAGTPSRYRELDGVSFEPRSIAENSCAVETECVAPKFNNDAREVSITVSNIQLDLSGEGNELDRTPETIRLLDMNENRHQNDIVGVDDASVEENIQTTPPDLGILAKPEVTRGRESTDAKMNQTSIGLPVCSEKSSSGALKQCPVTKCDAKLMNKMALNPCSRLRLFRNPKSVSYRRLLPFLMDISKADSCTTTKTQKKMLGVVYEEDRHPAPAVIAEHYFENNTPKENFCNKLYAEDRIQTTSDGSSPHSNSNLVSSIPELSATNYSSNIDPRPSNVLPESIGLSREYLREIGEPAEGYLQDAEEVASQLMKELTSVRLLLEKSTAVKKDSASIPPHPVLIKQACDRAIEAETLAKAHLGELNNDLSVHCRIPGLLQPKVSFAHSNQYREI
ncbi:hypothetical protein AAHA92_28419 [Salvia divinorum]|uniref:Uncharacterized protein n=1 Tax=Salvia divinorum TaxID=28513 RepID=A0ABD1FV02_SALDI